MTTPAYRWFINSTHKHPILYRSDGNIVQHFWGGKWRKDSTLASSVNMLPNRKDIDESRARELFPEAFPE